MKKYIIFCIILFISILILSIVLYYRKKQQYEEFKRHEPMLNSLKTDIEKLVPYLTHDEIIK
jgi:preprotein translocase subunit YajC